jgi:hypothetical protein
VSSPIIITGRVVGAEMVTERLSVLAPTNALERMRATVRALGYQLEARVKTVSLAGNPLNRRTGALARSVNTKFVSTPSSETASTGSNKSYGRIWELTGTRAFTIVPRNKKALFWPGAEHPVASVFHPAQAPRPWLRPRLEEMRPEIHAAITRAMAGL